MMSVTMVSFSPTDFMKKDAKGKGGTSSDDFIQFMEGLQSSRNIVADPSRAVSMATYTDSVYMKGEGELRLMSNDIYSPAPFRRPVKGVKAIAS